MPRISLATVDHATGTIQNSRNIQTTINDIPIAVFGDVVAPHPPCPRVPIHCNATMTAPTAASTINGIRIVLGGDPATCGHAASASATSTIT